MVFVAHSCVCFSVGCSSRHWKLWVDVWPSLMIAVQILLLQPTALADAINRSEYGFLTLERMTRPEAH